MGQEQWQLYCKLVQQALGLTGFRSKQLVQQLLVWSGFM
jgi:hypothetical protein